MREWFPVPGSTKARLIESAIHHFEQEGYEAVGVTDLARKAGVTTGALYHHFGSKLGLYTVIRDDFEKRIADRIEGAAAAIEDAGRPAVVAAVLVAFDAAARMNACRILGESPPADRPDLVAEALRSITPGDGPAAAPILVAAWRAALLSVADGSPSHLARSGLEFVLGK